MNELEFKPTAYGWLACYNDWSFYLNGDEDHSHKPTVLSSDKDGWKVQFKQTIIGLSWTGNVWMMHVK